MPNQNKLLPPIALIEPHVRRLWKMCKNDKEILKVLREEVIDTEKYGLGALVVKYFHVYEPELVWERKARQFRRWFTPGFKKILQEGVTAGWYDTTRPLDVGQPVVTSGLFNQWSPVVTSGLFNQWSPVVTSVVNQWFQWFDQWSTSGSSGLTSGQPVVPVVLVVNHWLTTGSSCQPVVNQWFDQWFPPSGQPVWSTSGQPVVLWSTSGQPVVNQWFYGQPVVNQWFQ
ncbi:hypothetical protein BJ912DRAFT_920508 [Pholiota molesta]|nr:hypothetical protein BJ912DRAFT_920508 [Pholiota molesta]